MAMDRRVLRIRLVAGLALWLLAGSTAQAVPRQLIQRGLQRGCLFAYYPNRNALWIRLNFERRNVRLRKVAELGARFASAEVTVRRQAPDAEPIASVTVKLDDGKSDDVKLDVPDLEGVYELRFAFRDGEQTYEVSRFFERKRYKWENNVLGKTDEVYAPFTPVRQDGQTVEVVGRTYRIGAAGLLDEAVTLGRNILAGPMRIRFTTANGVQGEWTASVRAKGATEQVARYEAEAASGPVLIRTRTAVEFDGCVRVDMTLAPGADPAEVSKLWLEIPLKADEAPLFHQMVDGPRINFAGAMPDGKGVVWDSTKARRYGKWQNSFCPYIWLGAERRGLAWFAENDANWVTPKGDMDTPLQTVSREGGKVVLRAYLIAQPHTLTEPRHIVFGVQVSPTKPMPDNWRVKLHTRPGMSGPVNPWGGLHCAYKFPYRDDWSIVDKILEVRAGETTPEAAKEWIKAYDEKHDPPNVYGTKPWHWQTSLFVRKVERAKEHPVLVYHEEMAASVIRPEWHTFQDEWGHQFYTQRDWPTQDLLRKGFNANPGSKVTFPPSYRDYGCYYANEWLQRGVGLYWDNTYPNASVDTRMTAAYETEHGVQPALILWNQRAYQQRVWNLLQQWRKKQRWPLEWSNHITNTLVLPIHTFATTTLDLEWARPEPFPPDFIRAESISRQVGNYPHCLNSLLSRAPEAADLRRHESEHIEWGMRMVHEIGRGGPNHHRPGIFPLERAVFSCGYGQPGTDVHEYWSETPAAVCGEEAIKWLVLARPERKDVLLVLASWSPEAVEATVTLNPKVIGFAPPPVATELFTMERLAMQGNRVTVPIPAPFGCRVVRFTARPLQPAGALMFDDFEDGMDLRWDSLRHDTHLVAAEGDNTVLRLAANKASWQGPLRLQAWPDRNAAWRDYVLTFRFRLGKLPPSDAESQRLFRMLWYGRTPQFSKHGLTHTAIDDSYAADLTVGGGRFGLIARLDTRRKNPDRDKRHIATDWSMPLDTEWRRLTVRVVDGRSTVLVDGRVAWTGTDDRLAGGGFGLEMLADLPALVGHLDIDDVRVLPVGKDR